MESVNNDNDYESPYCEKCEACGEDGCCSYTTCFSALIEDSKCSYGRTYLKAAILDKKLVKLSFEIFSKLEKKEITAEQAVIEFDEGWHKCYDSVYRDDVKIEKNT
jgi:hypothetical protein